jgi:EpsI family protein
MTTESQTMPAQALSALQWRSWAIAAFLVAAAVLARAMTPDVTQVVTAPSLEQTVPQQFGGWTALPSALTPMTVSRNEGPDMSQPYDQTVMRTYANQSGERVTLAVAWGQRQRQEVKIHRPELCYPAQGHAVKSLTSHVFDIESLQAQQPVVGKRMVTADRDGVLEVVSYWIRIGSNYSDSALETRMHILKEGLAGRYADGILVRVSQRAPASAMNDLEPIYRKQEQFVKTLVQAVDPATRDLFIR